MNLQRRASKEGSERAVVEEVMGCGGGAEIVEDEVLSHAVAKLSPEALLVKEKRVHQEVEHAAAGQDDGEGQLPPSKGRDWTPSVAAAST
jgi:hypothetical protein